MGAKSITLPVTPEALLEISIEHLNLAIENTDVTEAKDRPRVFAAIAHTAAVLLATSQNDAAAARDRERMSLLRDQGERIAGLSTLLPTVPPPAEMKPEERERLIGVARREVLTVLAKHDTGNDARFLRLDRTQLEEVTNDILGCGPRVLSPGTGANGVFFRDGAWFIDCQIAIQQGGEVGPFESEDVANAAASYVFAHWIGSGAIATRDEALRAIKQGPVQ